MRAACLFGLLVILLGLTACSSGARPDEPTPVDDVAGLANLWWMTGGVYSGGQPDGEAAFAALADLGVATVVSVDAAAPDVGTAAAHGIRTVHIPIDYNGPDEDQAMALARVLHDARDPVYVHCHHGKHRGPAAAYIALVMNGRMEPDSTGALLDLMGTSRSYTRLFDQAAAARAIDAAVIAAADVELPAIAEVGTIAETMASIDRLLDQLKRVRHVGWEAPPDHPDIVPAADAGAIADMLRMLRDTDEAAEKDDIFITMLTESARRASELEHALDTGGDPASPMTRLVQSCRDCHDRFQ